MDKFTVALVQHHCSIDIDRNVEQSIEGIRDAQRRGAELVVLPELHRTSYFCQSENVGHFELAETIPGPSTELFRKIARDLGVVLVISLFEKRAAGLYHNTAVVIERDGHIAGTYRKMHIPDDPSYYEKFYFTPGDSGFAPVSTGLGRLGVMVCWDQWYPEPARLMTLKGADLLIYPTAIGWEPADPEDEKSRQLEAWMTVQRGHAIANGIPVLAANRTGFEPNPSGQGSSGIHFWGTSFVAGPQGEILARAAANKGEVLIAEIDKTKTEKTRQIWPFLRDRRIDAYSDLLKRYADKAP